MLEERALLSVNPTLGDVFYIEMENHNLLQPSSVTSPQQLAGNPAAPYLNSLMTPGNPNAAQTSYAINYYNAQYNLPSVSIHPSEPNYVWQEAGLTGPLNDADPYANTPNNIVNAPNLSALLQNAGIPWKSYQEDIDLATTAGANGNIPGNIGAPGMPPFLTSTVAPQSQWTVPTSSFSGNSSAYTNAYNGSNQYNFAVKHDGQLFFTATNGGSDTAPNFSPLNPEAKYYAPLQQLQTDLNNNTVARYNLITPDQYNDMHSSLTGGFTYNGTHYTGDQAAVAEGDNFLSIIIPKIEASQAYKNNGAIVIWYDESEGGNTTQFTLPEVVISPLAKGNAYQSTLPYTHSSDLKSMQELFGVSAPGGGFLGDASTPGTNDLSDMFKPGALTPPVQAVEGLPLVNAPVASLTTPLVPGNLLVSESVYQGTASTVTVGQTLPPNQTVPPGVAAIADGTYPTVFNNNTVDGSFGVTAPIYLDQLTTYGIPVGSPMNVTAEAAAAGISLSTSFSSKSELSLNLSPDGTAVTFMGYDSAINQLDVSNSNTPNPVDPTNPVLSQVQRAVGQIDANGNLQVTPVNAYSGNNGRAAILANGKYYMTGNAGNSGSGVTGTTLSQLSDNTGVQMIVPGSSDPNTTVVGQVNGVFGNTKGYQRGFSITNTNPLTGQPYSTTPDKTGKDDNFRGETIFNSTLYVTKGSGSNGINTVYQVGAAGSLPTLANAGTTPITILPGFPTNLASSTQFFPFGIWFANATTLYVADEGDGKLADAATDPNAGLEKWSLVNGVWNLDYTLQNGLNLGVPYTVPGYPTGTNPVTGMPWSPETDGLRNITGKVNGDGTVTIYAITSTVSGSGDQGADPNKLVAITDNLSAPTLPTSEQFTTMKSAGSGEVLRGVSFTPTPTLTGTTATINWGDGTLPTQGTVSLSGNTYTVTGTHTYNKEGTYPIMTTFTQQGYNTTVFTTTVHNTAVVQDNIGILLLDASGKGALTASGNASVSVTGSHGAIVVDSSNGSAAIASGNAIVSAGDFDATGTSTSGNGTLPAPVDTDEAPLADPLAYLSAPAVPTTVQSTKTLKVSSSMTLQPGLYIGGIDISGSAHVTLEPGLYYLEGDGFTVSGSAIVTDKGKGVLLYNAPGKASGGITISGGASVTLSGLSATQVSDLGLTGNGYVGLAIFEDRNYSASLSVTGSGTLNVTGTVYAADAKVEVSSNGSLNLKGDAKKKFASHLLVADLTVSGNAAVSVDTSDNYLEPL